MTFEEFFKKKKIDLAQLQIAEPTLFAEFKNHFELMGEKSFDHTKKYWFNQLRHKYVPPPEVKAEKVIIENQLAEQTIIESLTEPVTPSPSAGFKPRFKAGATTKPAEEKPAGQPEQSADKPEEPAAPMPSAGFKPRFKASMVSKPAEEKPAEEVTPTAEEKPVDDTAPKPAVGFKPRFKASMVSKPAEEKNIEEATPAAEEKPVDDTASKPAVGFKPRFKASMVSKPAEEKPAEEVTPTAEEKLTDDTAPKPAVGFKPRFKASMVAKPTEEQKEAAPVIAENQPALPEEKAAEPAEEKPAGEVAPKPVGFKPRFNAAKMTKPKEPGEE
jgi:hypothetical protein